MQLIGLTVWCDGIKYVHRKVSELIKFGTIGRTILYQCGVRKRRLRWLMFVTVVWYLLYYCTLR
jgi:hypothetical protein